MFFQLFYHSNYVFWMHFGEKNKVEEDYNMLCHCAFCVCYILYMQQVGKYIIIYSVITL